MRSLMFSKENETSTDGAETGRTQNTQKAPASLLSFAAKQERLPFSLSLLSLSSLFSEDPIFFTNGSDFALRNGFSSFVAGRAGEREREREFHRYQVAELVLLCLSSLSILSLYLSVDAPTLSCVSLTDLVEIQAVGSLSRKVQRIVIIIQYKCKLFVFVPRSLWQVTPGKLLQ